MLPSNQWFSGFFYGTSSFKVCVYTRKDSKSKEHFQAEFSIFLPKEDLALLNSVMKLFTDLGSKVLKKDSSVGIIVKVSDTHLEYRIRNVKHLTNVIVPYFKKYPLKGARYDKVVRFCEICSLLDKQFHLDETGIKRVKEKINSFNSKPKQKDETF